MKYASTFIGKILRFFDKLEDHVRNTLSRYPIIYSLVGGIAIVLFWRGVWDTADQFPFLSGPMSIIISVTVLLMTGLFASFFVGDTIIISGLRREKKVADKTASELEVEKSSIDEARKELRTIEAKLDELLEEEKRRNRAGGK